MERKEAIALGLKTYFNGKPCPKGHVALRRCPSGACSQCVNESKALKRWNQRTDLVDEYRKITRAEAKSLGLIYYYTSKKCKHGHNADRFTSTGLCTECNRLNTAKIRQKQPGYMKKYREDNKEKLKKKRKEDPNLMMINCMREMLRRVRRLTGTKKAVKTEELMGYSRLQLVSHLESLFSEGMTWDNHGEWHIDHIIPLSVMIKQGITDPKVVNALSNLQPLWAHDNHAKSAKVI